MTCEQKEIEHHVCLDRKEFAWLYCDASEIDDNLTAQEKKLIFGPPRGIGYPDTAIDFIIIQYSDCLHLGVVELFYKYHLPQHANFLRDPTVTTGLTRPARFLTFLAALGDLKVQVDALSATKQRLKEVEDQERRVLYPNEEQRKHNRSAVTKVERYRDFLIASFKSQHRNHCQVLGAEFEHHLERELLVKSVIREGFLNLNGCTALIAVLSRLIPFLSHIQWRVCTKANSESSRQPPFLYDWILREAQPSVRPQGWSANVFQGNGRYPL